MLLPFDTHADYVARVDSVNGLLEGYKLGKELRVLLVAKILVALENSSFREKYKQASGLEKLDRRVDRAFECAVRVSEMDTARLVEMSDSFCIQNVNLDCECLRKIVEAVEEGLFTFRKQYPFVDILGDLHVACAKNGGEYGGMGVVLTPAHICDLFVRLAGVDVMSGNVLDICAGSGRFLMSSASRIVATGGSPRGRLFGIEAREDMFWCLICNLYDMDTQKGSFVYENCFNGTAEIPRNVDVAFINPPYRKNKKMDINEMQFVKQSLDLLQAGGVCIALLPMSCALDIRGKTGMLKKEILQTHRLLAVLSLPDELFWDSGVSVATCAMIFEAGEAHSTDKEVFLGYYKDDGFETSKRLGRWDSNGTWNEKMEEWSGLYKQRESKPGMSVNVKLDETMEWAAEAYLETDYASLSDEHFIQTLHSYSSYLFANSLLSEVTDCSYSSKKNVLEDTKNWKQFLVSDLFDVTGTSKCPLDTEAAENSSLGFPYVTTKATNNGVAGFYSMWTEESPVLCIESAVQGFCTYQGTNFSASDHVEKLVPKFEMDSFIAMFLTTILNLEQYRYCYGRKSSQRRIKETKIKLPSVNSTPDWNSIRRYIQSLPYSQNMFEV